MTAIIPKPFRVGAITSGESITAVDFLDRAEKTAARNNWQVIPGVFVPQAVLDDFADVASCDASLLLNAIRPPNYSVPHSPGE